MSSSIRFCKKKLVVHVIAALILLFFSGFSYGQQDLKKVVIIRHGEKPDKGDNLSCEGLNRSQQLASVLYKKIGIPSQVYVPALNLGKNTTTARMYQTIIPFAVKYNLHINSKFAEKDAIRLSEEIKNKGGTILLVWEHNTILQIVSALGIKESLSWDDNDFDSIWIITFEKGIPQLLKDKEGIKPLGGCQ